MCGRHDNLIAREAYPTLYRAMRLPASSFPPRHDIAPTDQVCRSSGSILATGSASWSRRGGDSSCSG